MEAKQVLYAAVGAPVVAARKVSDRVAEWREQMNKETAGISGTAEKAIEAWAAEGKKVVERIGNGNVVEEISSKVDLDQAKEQVGKLRDQLEDMLDTWRTSFRPERAETVPVEKQPAKAPAKKPAAKKPAPTTESSTAKSSTAKKPAAKSSTAKSSTAKGA
jgi:hypothetical protein